MQGLRTVGLDFLGERKKAVGICVAMVFVLGGITALSVSHEDSKHVSSVTAQQVAPPADGHKEPLDGGSALVAKSAGGDATSDLLNWLLGLAAGPGNGEPSHPAASRPPNQKSKHAVPKDPWTVPVDNYVVTARYGQPGGWAAGHHTGIDLAVPVGTKVNAVHDGTVVIATLDDDYGNYVLIHQKDGFYTLYAHMSKLMVRAGEKVTCDQLIGLSGATGRVTGPHLHFEVRTGPVYGSDVDPVAYMRRHHVTL
ncbi:murein DD-endopeptidase MepM/ murein hydrolase activator NlpD [Streptomyces sp. B3I7]|uniref:M23 family metallopeptidase n=1 Tax=Streptomyces sp. B3I7 TaxID=3042269 RepID=UPI0027823F3A|nr:M23 family metallopeptidase [Streptomyces sp. B3I7]MDQ0808466.1 murein DD-endopeptidase MepM/ murein hydrolase activator NlpD [Streptomyces sp. B3I7]